MYKYYGIFCSVSLEGVDILPMISGKF